jgi:hypothetical protein
VFGVRGSALLPRSVLEILLFLSLLKILDAGQVQACSRSVEVESSQSSQCGVMQRGRRSIRRRRRKVLRAAGFASVPTAAMSSHKQPQLDERAWLSFALGD